MNRESWIVDRAWYRRLADVSARGVCPNTTGGTPVPRRRGTAEVELLLCIIILMMTLFLAWGAGKIARLRLQVTDTSHTSAVRDATVLGDATDAADSPTNPITADLVSPLPNRIHTASASGNLTLDQPNGKQLTTVALTAKSSTMSPWWTYTDYTNYAPDQAATKTWYDNRVGDYHEPLESPFKLAPSWPP